MTFFHFLFFHFVSLFVSPLYFPVVVPRYSTPGGRVQVLELVSLAEKRARGLGPSRCRVQVLEPDAVGSKSWRQTLSGRSPRASRSYYFSLFFSFVFIVFHEISLCFHIFFIINYCFLFLFLMFFFLYCGHHVHSNLICGTPISLSLSGVTGRNVTVTRQACSSKTAMFHSDFLPQSRQFP